MSSERNHAGATEEYLQDSYWPTVGVPDVPGFARLRLVGSGGSATVYKAVELRHDRPVAIKILDVQAGDSQRRAFAREVEAIARIEPHPNIITLLGSGVTPNGHPYLAFPYFDGGTFAAWIDERGPLTWSAAIDVSIKICSAVETVHRAGLIHRDVKPGNVFIGVTPAHPVLGDFGISTLVEGIPSRTVQQAVTVGYTAPEILQDEPATTVSDIYSLGMTIFRIVQGLHAYYAKSPAAVMRNVLNQSEAPHLSAGVPPSLDEAVSGALAENPADRPQTALDLARQLQAVQADHYLPVTPLLVTGEPGVPGEEAPPVPKRKVPPHPGDTGRVDPGQADVVRLKTGVDQHDLDELPPLTQTGPGHSAETMTDHGVDPTRSADRSVDANPPSPMAEPTERADAGAIVANAVNTNGAPFDPRQTVMLTRSESAAPVPPQLPEPSGPTAGSPHIPDSLDQATQARPRVSRAELLEPKPNQKKRRWWSRRKRRS